MPSSDCNGHRFRIFRPMRTCIVTVCAVREGARQRAGRRKGERERRKKGGGDTRTRTRTTSVEPVITTSVEPVVNRIVFITTTSIARVRAHTHTRIGRTHTQILIHGPWAHTTDGSSGGTTR